MGERWEPGGVGGGLGRRSPLRKRVAQLAGEVRWGGGHACFWLQVPGAGRKEK